MGISLARRAREKPTTEGAFVTHTSVCYKGAHIARKGQGKSPLRKETVVKEWNGIKELFLWALVTTHYVCRTRTDSVSFGNTHSVGWA
jgi:hypothetical protein